jgi:hypothetical protein
VAGKRAQRFVELLPSKPKLNYSGRKHAGRSSYTSEAGTRSGYARVFMNLDDLEAAIGLRLNAILWEGAARV